MNLLGSMLSGLDVDHTYPFHIALKEPCYVSKNQFAYYKIAQLLQRSHGQDIGRLQKYAEGKISASQLRRETLKEVRSRIK